MTGMRHIYFILVALVVWHLLLRKQRMVWVNGYRVKNEPDARHASNLLDQLTTRIRLLLSSTDQAREPRIVRIKKRWNGTLAELDGGTSKNIAHSIGKRAISICIRNPNGSLADENTCMYVIIHELAHIATHSIGHTPEFWKNMRYLLEVGEATGAYHYTDHDKEHVMLCGRALGTNPMSCLKDKTCTSSLTQAPQKMVPT